MPGERFIGSDLLWGYPLRMNIGDMEIGGLYKDTSVGRLGPMIVRVWLVNNDGTVTVIETYYQDVRAVRVEHLWGVDYFCVPPWEEVNVPRLWAEWPTRPRCVDKHCVFN